MDGAAPRRPHPVRLRRTLRLHEVDAHRRVGCGRYPECLERAARRAWLSFTCVRCFAFRPQFDESPQWTLQDALEHLAAGLGNRAYPGVEWWLASRPAPERTQL